MYFGNDTFGGRILLKTVRNLRGSPGMDDSNHRNISVQLMFQ